jgi:hypothetical protein
MKPLQLFFNKILGFWKHKWRVAPQDIPKLLDKQSLEQVMREAQMLKASYHVEVRELAPGEEAGPPRPAGDFPHP